MDLKQNDKKLSIEDIEGIVEKKIDKIEKIEEVKQKKKTIGDIFTEKYSKLLKVRGLFILFSFFIASAGEILFLGDTLGLGFALFTIIYVAGFALIAKITKQLRNYWAFGFAIPLVAFGLSNFLYSNALVMGWTAIFAYILMILYPLFLTLKNPNKYRFSLTQIPLVKNPFLPFEKIKYISKDLTSFTSLKLTSEQRNLFIRISIALLISVPILTVFGLLFYYADSVFAVWAKQVFDYIHLDISWGDISKLLRIFIIAIGINALFYVFLSKNHLLGNKNEKVFRIDDIIVGIVLGLVNMLFAIFVFIQFTYLFGTRDYVMTNNMVFADYARSGFFQLAWVMVLATLMLMVIYRSAVFHKAK